MLHFLIELGNISLVVALIIVLLLATFLLAGDGRKFYPSPESEMEDGVEVTVEETEDGITETITTPEMEITPESKPYGYELKVNPESGTYTIKKEKDVPPDIFDPPPVEQVPLLETDPI